MLSWINILGVTLASNLDFFAHISGIVSRARRPLECITRVTKPCGPVALRTFYTALVHFTMEYCSAIWSPAQKHHCERLESVQRRATRIICGRSSNTSAKSYDTRLGALGWRPPVERRRTSWARALCQVLDGSLSGTPLSSGMPVSRSPGQPEPLRGRTIRHSESLIPAVVRDFLTISLATRSPLPTSYEEFRELCAFFSHRVASGSS